MNLRRKKTEAMENVCPSHGMRCFFLAFCILVLAGIVLAYVVVVA